MWVRLPPSPWSVRKWILIRDRHSTGRAALSGGGDQRSFDWRRAPLGGGNRSPLFILVRDELIGYAKSKVMLVLWFLIPFAIFGIKGLLKEMIFEQRRTNELLRNPGS